MMNLGYTGKPYDTGTGLYNYGYRDYSPQAARFTTVDPIRDGSNWYAYVNNDPVNWIDLWGLSASDVRQKMANLATDYEDHAEWKTVLPRNVPGIGNFVENTYKCNLFVYEVAIEAGANPGVLQKAGSWGNSYVDIPGMEGFR